MTYGDFKDLAKRTASEKVLRDKAFNIVKSGLASMVYNFFDTKSSGSGIKNEITQNQQLAEQLHKPIIRKLKKRNVYSLFKDNIFGAALADMQLISKFNKVITLLLCVIDTYSKYGQVSPLKEKMVQLVLMHFKKYWIIR